AVTKGKWPDQLIRVGFLFALTTPSFWFGILLILFFGLTLHWFPVAGFGDTFPQHVWYLFLPALTLALQLSAVLIRNLRGQIILTLRSDYVRTAHAKGLSESLVLLRHVLRNALLSTLTILGLQFGLLVGGATVVQTGDAPREDSRRPDAADRSSAARPGHRHRHHRTAAHPI